MKILMFAPIFPPMIGGPATQTHSLCGALHKRGERVAVITPGEHFEHESPDGYRVYRYPWQYTGTVLDKVIRWIVFPCYFTAILWREKPEIVHAQSVSVSSFIAALIAKIFGRRTVLKFAGDWVWETLSTGGVKAQDFAQLRERSALARFMWRVEKLGLSLFDQIWAPSEFRAQNVHEVQGHRRNVTIIYNALELPPGGYHDVSLEDEFVVVAANRFIPHKRIPQIVEAFAKLENSAAKLVLVGTGQEGEIEKTREAAREYGVESRVTLTGRIEIEEVYEHFKKASIYVSNSLEEGFPNVFVEAMHFGLPIVSTDVGGCKEIVREGETGFLFEPMDQQALLEKMTMLMNDHVLRNRMAQAAYHYSNLYDLNVVLDQFLDLYRAVLSR